MNLNLSLRCVAFKLNLSLNLSLNVVMVKNCDGDVREVRFSVRDHGGLPSEVKGVNLVNCFLKTCQELWFYLVIAIN